ncbi:MAG: hypothetical protein KF802_13110 [Bdellovibrionaceae bacterium]|nr:hypothetical protein [Pseudobdellovibrionaceae bacterium]
MKPWLKWASAFMLMAVYVACSPKQFAKDSSFNACQNSGKNCITEDGRDFFDYSETIEGGKVDVLVVSDNSASMSYEQANLANRFNGFIKSMDDQRLDYKIGVITTDISNSQAGRLVAPVITQHSGDLLQKDAAFKAAVQRPETAACEQFITSRINACRSQGRSDASCMSDSSYISGYNQTCPSGDERGIYAARLAVEQNADSFVRPEADLAVIILSDEDVRGGLYRTPSTGERFAPQRSAYALADADRAQNFVSAVNAKYPGKVLGVHTFVVYSDLNCIQQQNAQTLGVVDGSYGIEYEALRAATGGVGASICQPDYAPWLTRIFDNVKSRIVDKMLLACSAPADLTVTLTNNSDPSITWTVVGAEVRFNKKLPSGTTARVTYSCTTIW